MFEMLLTTVVAMTLLALAVPILMLLTLLGKNLLVSYLKTQGGIDNKYSSN